MKKRKKTKNTDFETAADFLISFSLSYYRSTITDYVLTKQRYIKYLAKLTEHLE